MLNTAAKVKQQRYVWGNTLTADLLHEKTDTS